MRFEEFAGNDNAKQMLSACVDGGRIPQALLIEGPPGSGRRTLARLTARAALCTSGGEKPCDQCPSCIKAKSGNHPDIFEAVCQELSYKIKYIREIRENSYIKPNESERRVVIIPDSKLMQEASQNVLLKVFEDSPNHTIFILTCENRAQLLPTVLSRAVCLRLGPVEISEAAIAIKRILPETTDSDALDAAAVSGGIIGQAIKGITDGSYRRALELAPRFASAVVAPDELELMRLTGQIEKDKELADSLLSVLSLIFEDALVRKAGAESGVSPDPGTAEVLSLKLTNKQLYDALKAIGRLELSRKHYINHTLFLTLLCSRLRAAAGR